MPLLSDHNIEIIIVDDSRSRSCNAGCGMDWTSAETITLADRQIKAMFGDKAQLEQMDLSGVTAGSLAQGLQQEIMNGSLSLPLLIINGEPRISGPFDIRMLLDAIGVVVETNL